MTYDEPSNIYLHEQPRIHRMVRPIPHRRRTRRLLRRSLPRARLPPRHEPRRHDPPSLPPDRLDWMDRWCGAGRLRCGAVYYGCYCFESWDRVVAACVSFVLGNASAVNWFSARMLMLTGFFNRVVGMMGVMFFLWVVVPKQARRID